MFVIESAQFDEMKASHLERYVSETRDYLRERFPDECSEKSDGDLEALVNGALDLGKRYDVTSRYDVRRLSECLLIYGADFSETEATAWARHILRRDDLSGRDKMTGIANYEAFNPEVLPK